MSVVGLRAPSRIGCCDLESRPSMLRPSLIEASASREIHVASLDELVGQASNLVDEIDRAMTGAASADQTAQQVQETFAGVGAEDKVQHMSAVRDSIDRIRGQLQGAAESTKNLVSQAQAVKTGS